MNHQDRSLVLPAQNGKDKLSYVAVSAVDRTSNESNRTETHMNVLSIIPRTGWNAAEARPYKSHVPIKITVHHEGGKVLLRTDDAAQRLKNVQTWSMGKDRNWTDIPYHFLIGTDGTVFEGRNPLTVGETNTEYDPTGHLLISFLGNYEKQELDENLLDVLTRLIAKLCLKYNISPETIGGHRDYSKITSCPGINIYPYIENGSIRKQVVELLAKK
jgi:hypothetical protein